MANFRVSRRAEDDLLAIAKYTLDVWGEQQAARYLDELEACCRRTAANPGLGRSCDHIRAGLLRVEHAKHVVFYRKTRHGILISRILHQAMLPDKHVMDDEEE